MWAPAVWEVANTFNLYKYQKLVGSNVALAVFGVDEVPVTEGVNSWK